MSASYALSRDCQVFRKDVEGVLTLAAQVLFSSPPGASSEDASVTAASTSPPSSSSSASHRLAVGPLIGAVLTEASTRALLLNTLVRVLVPTQRAAALLQDNKYVQVANELAKKNQQQQQQQSSTATNHAAVATKTGVASASPAGSANTSGDQTQQYRVGRVVGVVPKPGAKQMHGASSKGGPGASDAAQRWLLAVYVGECVEPFHPTAISDDAFTETEYRIFVQSALSTNREDGSRRAGVLPSQQPALLSSEMAATVQQSIKEVRRVLELIAGFSARSNVDGHEDTTATEAKADALRSEVLQRASGVKRQRESDVEPARNNATDDLATAATAAAESSAASPSLAAIFGHGAASQAARFARLTDDLAARSSQLQQLRHLLQQKEQEVKSALQQQQQAEARHRSEVDVWRAKAEEQSRAQERAAKEAAQSLEQRDRLLEEANTKLRRLAGMATKYKQVVDTVATMVRRGSENGSESGKPMSPEEILAALQHKSIV